MDFVTTIAKLVDSGVISTNLILLGLVGSSAYFYKYFLKPMNDKIRSIETYEDFKVDLTEEIASILTVHDHNVIKEVTTSERMHISKIEDALDSITSRITVLGEESRDHTQDIRHIREDVLRVKEILVQFQGHMMYPSNGPSNFGNKELR